MRNCCSRSFRVSFTYSEFGGTILSLIPIFESEPEDTYETQNESNSALLSARSHDSRSKKGLLAGDQDPRTPPDPGARQLEIWHGCKAWRAGRASACHGASRHPGATEGLKATFGGAAAPLYRRPCILPAVCGSRKKCGFRTESRAN